jgi:hypothetical protein
MRPLLSQNQLSYVPSLGTMSLNDLAVDLTCDPADFVLSSNLPSPVLSGAFDSSHSHATDEAFDEEGYTLINEEDILKAVPGSYPGFIDVDRTPNSSFDGCDSVPKLPFGNQNNYQVHGGIYKMALAMGSVGRPVWMVVRQALMRNHGYDLILCGHSLGAGLSGLLALVRFTSLLSERN